MLAGVIYQQAEESLLQLGFRTERLGQHGLAVILQDPEFERQESPLLIDVQLAQAAGHAGRHFIHVNADPRRDDLQQ